MRVPTLLNRPRFSNIHQQLVALAMLEKSQLPGCLSFELAVLLTAPLQSVARAGLHLDRTNLK
jgi:hypothetical protein